MVRIWELRQIVGYIEKKEQDICERTFEESFFNRPTQEVTRLVKLNGKDHGREVHFYVVFV